MLQGYLAIIASMLIWGSVGVFARKAGQDPVISVTYRLIFGAVALGLASLMQRRSAAASQETASAQRRPGHWMWLVLSGIALSANWLFFFKAVDTTTISNAVLSYYTAPILVALATPFVLREPLERRTVMATALAFAGVVIMLYQPGQPLSGTDLLGISYGLTAACFYALVTLSMRWISGISSVNMVLVQCVSAAAVLIPYVLNTHGSAALRVPAGALGLLAVIGVVHTALALFLYVQGLRSIKVQHVGVLAYLDPVSAVLFAYLFLREVPAANSLIGGALVLGGSALLLHRSAG